MSFPLAFAAILENFLMLRVTVLSLGASLNIQQSPEAEAAMVRLGCDLCWKQNLRRGMK